MLTQYKSGSVIYDLYHCTEEDIPSHIERVLPYWTDVNIADQIEALKLCIANGTAYKVINNSNQQCTSCVYLYKEDSSNAQSYLLWTANKSSIAVLLYSLKKYQATITRIYFYPHDPDNIPFKFLLTDSSIEDYKAFDIPLRINPYSRQVVELTNRFNVQEIIWED